MPLLRTYSVFWLGALVLFVFVVWTMISKDDGQSEYDRALIAGSNINTNSELSDRDNAAEEVRAVATRISNIEQAIENQMLNNQAERQQLHKSLTNDLEDMRQTFENNLSRNSISQIADSVDDLKLRLNLIETQQTLTTENSIESAADTAFLYWVSSVDTDQIIPFNESLQIEIPEVSRESLNPQLLQFENESLETSYLTIPATTTLLGATALTALVGRIPNRGQLQDPWRFKVLVGSSNLASNGHRIPHLAGMLLAGTARGDLSLSCVSGNIDTATFIFADGTIQTTRKVSDPESTFTGLGWISDEFGNPCIEGELKSNALQYLTQATLINTTRATAEAIANAQTETSNSVGSDETTTAVVGDIDQFVAGYATKESLLTVADWLNDRQLNSFDAIYVPAGQSVAIHIEETIQIDQEPNARKVQNFNLLNTHDYARQGWTD